MCSKLSEHNLPTISVALCTYNGAGFLKEQLYSYAAQTHLPGELVANDDLSDDETLQILEDQTEQLPFPVRLGQNTKRCGIRKNFEQAIFRCSKKYIALSDQDDVWFPEKLQHFAKEFADGADWVCCDADVVDDKLVSQGYTMWQRTKFTTKEKKNAKDGRILEVLLKHYAIAGATLAFRADLRDIVLPIPPDWHYDAWIVAVLSAISKGVLIDIPLQQYRQHDSNVIGGGKRSLIKEALAAFSLNRENYYRKEITCWMQLAERLSNMDVPSYSQTLIDLKIEHLKRRAAFPSMRLTRLPMVIREILQGGYKRFARNWGSVAIDLLLK